MTLFEIRQALATEAQKTSSPGHVRLVELLDAMLTQIEENKGELESLWHCWGED